MSPNPWKTGNIIQPQYLNSLQELLSDYSDNVLLQASQSYLGVQASPSAPAQLMVNGLMRTNLSESFIEISGDAGSYNIYAVSTKSASTWYLQATPTQVSAAYTRKIGEVDFDGRVISDVRSSLREINVSHLLGHEVSPTAISQGIPAAGPDAKIDISWVDGLDANAIPVGGVRCIWTPDSVQADIPEGWRVLDGSTVSEASHAFVGVGSFTLPDMRNKMTLGADPSNVYASPGDSSGEAPGVGGIGGTAQESDTLHSHGFVASHIHLVATHAHSMTHSHIFEKHAHFFDSQGKRWRSGGTDSSSSSLIEATKVNKSEVKYMTDHDVYKGGDYNTQGTKYAQNVTQNVMSNTYVGDTGKSAAVTGLPIGGGSDQAAAGSIDVRPQSIGMVYVMRVL